MSAKIFLGDIEKLGYAIKTLRKGKKLTQEAVALKAGISKKHLRDIEKGRYSAGLDLVLLICDAMEVNRFKLFIHAWQREYFTYVEQEQITNAAEEILPDSEVATIANNGKSLRNVTEIEEKNFTKRLYGGGQPW